MVIDGGKYKLHDLRSWEVVFYRHMKCLFRWKKRNINCNKGKNKVQNEKKNENHLLSFTTLLLRLLRWVTKTLRGFSTDVYQILFVVLYYDFMILSQKCHYYDFMITPNVWRWSSDYYEIMFVWLWNYINFYAIECIMSIHCWTIS